MAPHVRPVPVQGVQQSDPMDMGHPLGHFCGREPLDCRGFVGRALGTAGRLAPEHQGHDADNDVLVDPGQLVDLGVDLRGLES